MYRTYRPKGTNVKAIQVTKDTFEYVLDWVIGRKTEVDGNPAVSFATFEGIQIAIEGQYILRNDKGYKVMAAEEFEDRYEPVRASKKSSSDD